MTALKTKDADLLQLAEAFAAFNSVSNQLEASYSNLESRISELREQLRKADEERRLASARNEQLALRLQQILEALPGGVVVLTEEKLVSECNSSAKDWFGGDIVGRSWQSIWNRFFNAELTEQGDLLHRDGRRLSLAQKSLAPEPGTILLLTDVTEQRQIEDVLARHRRLATLGEMVATLAHQVRTPAAAALLYASNALRPEIENSRRAEQITKAVDCLHDLERLVGDMLIFAGGKRETADEPVSVEELLGAIDTACRAHVTRRQTLIVSRPASGLGVRGNRETLASAIQNLVVNALQIAGDGAVVCLSATRGPAGAGLGTIEIRVEDNGPGIAKDDLKRIFEPFFSRREQGTGLGLAVAKSIIEAHGGQIRVESTGASGTVVLVGLPEIAECVEAATSVSGLGPAKGVKCA